MPFYLHFSRFIFLAGFCFLSKRTINILKSVWICVGHFKVYCMQIYVYSSVVMFVCIIKRNIVWLYFNKLIPNTSANPKSFSFSLHQISNPCRIDRYHLFCGDLQNKQHKSQPTEVKGKTNIKTMKNIKPKKRRTNYKK